LLRTVGYLGNVRIDGRIVVVKNEQIAIKDGVGVGVGVGVGHGICTAFVALLVNRVTLNGLRKVKNLRQGGDALFEYGWQDADDYIVQLDQFLLVGRLRISETLISRQKRFLYERDHLARGGVVGVVIRKLRRAERSGAERSVARRIFNEAREQRITRQK